MIPVNPRAWAWEALRGITHARPGTIFVGPTGETVRLRDDGGAGADPVRAIGMQVALLAAYVYEAPLTQHDLEALA